MTSRFRLRPLVLVLVLLGAGGGGAFAIAWHPAIAPATPPDRAAFAPERIARGAELAAIGDCAVCHTAPGGRPYAGGRAVPTPFGTVLRHQHHAGPGDRHRRAGPRRRSAGPCATASTATAATSTRCCPTRTSPAPATTTSAALYAFLMTRAPVGGSTPAEPAAVPAQPARRCWPAGTCCFCGPAPGSPTRRTTPTWNRGAYLVEAVGHCGACHTPHNALGAEQPARRSAAARPRAGMRRPLQAGVAGAAAWDRGRRSPPICAPASTPTMAPPPGR